VAATGVSPESETEMTPAMAPASSPVAEVLDSASVTDAANAGAATRKPAHAIATTTIPIFFICFLLSAWK
jgi:hypothetical protein